LPPAREFGLNDIVVSWNGGVPPLLALARERGYRVYVDGSLQQATAAAEKGETDGWSGIVLNVRQAQRAEIESTLASLRSAHPKLRFLVLNPDGKQPEMRGSLVIKRDSVLEVSSPTAQPWIDTNLALVRIEERSHHGQIPLYSFSWNVEESRPQQRSATDYTLAIAESGAFHADLILDMDERLQKALTQHDPEAWKLWNEVRRYANFYSQPTQQKLEAAANVAVVVDAFDTSDEVMNLFARHNIPFSVLLPADLKGADLEGFDIIVVLAKADSATCERLANFATHGKTAVLVDAHGSYPWHKQDAVRLNEHAVSYAIGSGNVLELSEPVTDPETFAQDIRRLMGKQNALLSLWNGLTTIAVPYRERGGTLKVIEFINYAEEPVRVQVRVKGSFSSVRYETPESACCKSLAPEIHDGFTEFVIPDLLITGRVHLEGSQPDTSQADRK
jgi:protein-tyrosine-phosphatase